MTNIAVASTMQVVDKHGTAATIGEKTLNGLLKVGVLRPCKQERWTYHTDLTHDAIDSLVDELGLDDCGFCHNAEPTHQVAVDHTKLTMHGKAVASRPLALCGDCALLLQTGDHDLLRDRLLDQSVELNRRTNRAAFDAEGEEKVRAFLLPVIDRVMKETLASLMGKPYPIPPREPGGFVVIGET